VAGDTNNGHDIFVHDTVSGATTRVSVDSAGTEGNIDSFNPSISGDGRYIAFQSAASNLVSGDTNGQADIFVHDQVLGSTTIISIDAEGAQSMGGESVRPSISTDGRYVAFETDATNLVDNDTNGARDIVIRSIPNVTVTSITPDILPIGDTTSVTVTGTYFLPEADLIIGGTGKSVSDVVIVDENTITANITVDSGASTGARGVAVSLPGTGPGSLRGVPGNCAGCFTFGAAPLFCPTASLDDGIACTDDSCDESTDTISHTPNDSLCNDNNACTLDSCSAVAGCAFAPAPVSTPCDDGDENTIGDACDGAGLCVGNPL